MADSGVLGKRIRKKPKYLREDEEMDDNENPHEKEKSKPKAKKSKKSKEKMKRQSKSPAPTAEPKQGIKLKIKLGGRKVTTASIPAAKSMDGYSTTSSATVVNATTDDSDSVDVEGEAQTPLSFADDDVGSHGLEVEIPYASDDDTQLSQQSSVLDVSKPGGADGDDTSDEEREWLQAIESGDIEDYEKKKSERNPALLTARQRRLLHGEEEEQLIELPTRYKDKTLTEEQLNVRKQRAVKRRQQAIERSEKAKKQTVDRLLKKSEVAAAKAKSKVTKQAAPHIRYTISRDLHTLSLPADLPFPLQPRKARPPPKQIRCGVKGCKNAKKYNCSKTNLPLCSLVCYKKNLASSHHARAAVVT